MVLTSVTVSCDTLRLHLGSVVGLGYVTMDIFLLVFLKYWELKKQQYCPKVLIVPLSMVIGGQKSFLCNKRSKSKSI